MISFLQKGTCVLPLTALLMMLTANQAFASLISASAVQDATLDTLLAPQKRGWLGADVATSIVLSEDKLLWLFGDTIVGTLTDQGARKGTMIRNSIAIQDLNGDSTNNLHFYWDMRDNIPGSFFMAPNYDLDYCYWPCSGLMVDDDLFIFCYKVTDGGGGAGAFAFEVVGTILIRVSNPLEPPAQWKFSSTELGFGGKHQGFCSAVIRHDDYVYLMGFDDGQQESAFQRQSVLARIGVDDLKTSGNLDGLRYWVKAPGGDGRWSEEPSDLLPIMRYGSAESTVYFDNHLNLFVKPIQTSFSSDISLVVAPELTGPWSEPILIYEIPERRSLEKIFAYAVKAHPALSRPGELVITYVVNQDDFWSLFSDCTTYYPRFIRARFGEPK